jgi:ATP-dependent exoDNAse (exonuclease V) beta subunit
LPHQLAHKPDAVRAARHESAENEPVRMGREDPIEYGVWWHETMEFLPWRGEGTEIDAYLKTALATAEAQGFGPRGREEVELLRGSGLWRELRQARWRIMAELSVVAPLEAVGWIDGVIDLVAQDESASELLVIDWKTNRLRSGEESGALLERLLEEYRPQLEAYGACLGRFFPAQKVTLGLYASGTGDWRAL